MHIVTRSRQRCRNLEQTGSQSITHPAFDNKGILTNKDNLETICQKISAKPQTVVVFMHGWKGSATPTDHNVVSFQNALEEVRLRTYKNSGRTLTGVYLTGNAQHLPGIAELPLYYFTQVRADAVRRGEGIAMAIKRLSTDANRGNREHFIVAGHSFGGRILGHVVGYHQSY